jgi:hypothetical protein
MTIHDEIRRHLPQQDLPGTWRRHADAAADAAEAAVYEAARAFGYLTTQAARIAAAYGRSLNL